MTLKRGGFTLENGAGYEDDVVVVGRLDGALQDGEQAQQGKTKELVDPINRLLRLLELDPLPPDTNESNLAERLEDAVGYAERNVVPPTAKAAMANRNRRPTAPRIPTDAEIAARLRAKGVDPKLMPRYGN